MKASKIFSFIIVVVLAFSATRVFAQGPPPPPPGGGGGGGGGSAPIDGGAGMFLLAAAFYGRRVLQNKETEIKQLV